jgi:ribose transport system substrate-binding protein
MTIPCRRATATQINTVSSATPASRNCVKRHTRAIVRPLSCIFATALLVGCGSDDKPAASNALNFAFIPKTSNNLVFKIGNDGAQFGARDLSHSRGRAVSVEYLASETLDTTIEQALVRKAITDKKDGLLVSCLDDAITAPINEAVAAGIPVITYDSDCPSSQRLGFYSMQSESSGAKAADLLASAMGTGTKAVAILTGRAGADNLERRITGFTNQLTAKYPNISVVTTVHCGETAESCGTVVEDQIISAYPDLDGLFVVGLWGLQAACTCDSTGMSCVCEDSLMPKWKGAAKGKLKTVAYDSLPFEIELVNQGYVSALIGQKYFGWGYDTVNLMFDHLTQGKEVSGFIDSGFDVVCPNNTADMTAKWSAADFRKPLSPECSL